MKKNFRNSFFSIFSFFKAILLFAFASFFVSCEYYDLPVKAYLEDKSSVPYFLDYSMSVSPAAIDSGGYPCVGSDKDLTVTYSVSNPKKRAVKAEVSFPEGSGATSANTSISVSENLDSVVLTIGQGVLSAVDGNTETFDISPTVTLLSDDDNDENENEENDDETEIFDSISFSLRCNTVPSAVTNAISMMFSDSVNYQNNLVVCLELPSEDNDAKYLEVYGHTFDLESSDVSSGLASGGWTLYKDSFAPGNLTSTVTESGYEYSSKNGGTSYFVLTDISDLLNKDLFTIGIKITDKGGLQSDEYQIPSKTLQLSSPVLKHASAEVSSGTEISQDSGEDYALFTLEVAENVQNASVSYVITDSSGIAIQNGTSVSPALFELYPNEDGSTRTYTITATASADGYVGSDEYSIEFSVSSRALTLSSSAGADSPVEIKTSEYTLVPSEAGNLVYSITKDGGALYSSADSTNGDEISSDGITFDLGSGTYDVEATLKKSYHSDYSFSQTVTVNITQSGGTSVVVPESLSFKKTETDSGYKITAWADGEDVTSSVTSWVISVLSDGLDIKDSAGFTVGTSGGNPLLKIPSGLAAGTYTIKITAEYNGETYSGSISFEKS